MGFDSGMGVELGAGEEQSWAVANASDVFRVLQDFEQRTASVLY